MEITANLTFEDFAEAQLSPGNANDYAELMLNRTVFCGKLQLGMEEIRRVYDALPPADRVIVSDLAKLLVECARSDVPGTKYNFDDGLCDVARLSLNSLLHAQRNMART